MGVITRLGEKIQARHAVHHVIAYDELCAMLLQLLKCLFTTPSFDNILEAHFSQHVLKDCSSCGDIINDHYLRLFAKGP